jgi:hypothetical protein
MVDLLASSCGRVNRVAAMRRPDGDHLEDKVGRHSRHGSNGAFLEQRSLGDDVLAVADRCRRAMARRRAVGLAV